MHPNRIRPLEASGSPVCEICSSLDPVMSLNLITDPADMYEHPVYWAACRLCADGLIPTLEEIDSNPELFEAEVNEVRREVWEELKRRFEAEEEAGE